MIVNGAMLRETAHRLRTYATHVDDPKQARVTRSLAEKFDRLATSAEQLPADAIDILTADALSEFLTHPQ